MSFYGNNQQKMAEIIFANRNKKYGSYILRTEYGSTVFRAVLYMALGIGSAIAVSYYFTKGVPQKKLAVEGQDQHDSIRVSVINLPEPEKQENKTKSKVPPTTPPPPIEKRNADLVRVQDSVAQVVQQAVNTDTSTSQTTSTIVSTLPPVSDPSLAIVSTGTACDTCIVVADYGVDSNAVFPGGMAALYRFVSSQLRYPSRAFNEGKEGTVFVRFVVDEHCRVTRPSTLNRLGFGLDEEALRVVRMIPNFQRPAKVKNVPVKVYFQLPIKFRYEVKW